MTKSGSIHQTATFFMKVSLVYVLLTFLLAAAVFAKKSEGQGVFDKKVTLSVQNGDFRTVLRKISRKTGVTFSYTRNTLPAGERVSVNANDEALGKLFSILFDPYSISYEAVGNNVVLRQERQPEQALASFPGPPTVVVPPVTGSVRDENGSPLAGVSVQIKGRSGGTTTNERGQFTLDAPAGATLVFTFVGFTTQEVPVNGRGIVDVVLAREVTGLREVVVTALGIEQQSKTLTYSTQSVKASELVQVRDPNNFLNSLQGKVANVLITQGGDGVGSAAKFILRGNRSIAGSSNALVVVDGVPSSQTINPDDIESVTILPGPSAAALYGSAAGNGVIVITTKKGTRGKISVNVNSGLVFESPFALPKFQNIYGQGNNGTLDPLIGHSWGEKMDGQSYTNYLGNPSVYSAQPSNVKDFFNDGISLNNSIDVVSGTDKMQTYLSYTNSDVHGIIPNNDLLSHNINLRITNQVSKRFSTDAKVTYFNRGIKNQLLGGEAANYPTLSIYQIPRNVSLADAKQFQAINSLGVPVPTPWPSTLPSRYQNPYWGINNDIHAEAMNRISGFLSVKFKITDWLNITGRANLEKYFERLEHRVYQGTIITNTYDGNPGGRYDESNINRTQRWFDAIFDGNNRISNNLKINYQFGAIYQDNRSDIINNIADGLNVTDKFSLNFATTPMFNTSGSEIQTQSVFGQFNLSYRDAVYLTSSFRNDWDSRLRSPHAFQYYSAGISGILSDLFNLPEYLSFLKANFSYAEVGNGGAFGLLTSSYSYVPGAGHGYLERSSVLPFPDLKPEIVKNYEGGIQAKFMRNRLGFTLTYYKSNSFNQLLSVALPVATGFASQYINAGNIENHGLELVLESTPVNTQNFSWNLAFNFSLNRNKVIKLTDEVKRIYLGSITLGSVPQVEVGGSFNDVVSYKWQKDAKGNYEVTDKGLPIFTSQFGSLPAVIGNSNPDEMLGITNSFSYNRFSFSVLVDGHIGGTIVSNTEMDLSFSGITDATVKYREGGWNLGGVDQDGNKVAETITAQQFWQTVSGKRTSVGQFFAYDATNFRIRQISLGYTIPVSPKSFLKSVRISVVARNLLWLYRGSSILDIPGLGKRKMWFDPDMSNTFGSEYAIIPSTRSIGFNLQLSF